MKWKLLFFIEKIEKYFIRTWFFARYRSCYDLNRRWFWKFLPCIWFFYAICLSLSAKIFFASLTSLFMFCTANRACPFPHRQIFSCSFIISGFSCFSPSDVMHKSFMSECKPVFLPVCGNSSCSVSARTDTKYFHLAPGKLAADFISPADCSLAGRQESRAEKELPYA